EFAHGDLYQWHRAGRIGVQRTRASMPTKRQADKLSKFNNSWRQSTYGRLGYLSAVHKQRWVHVLGGSKCDSCWPHQDLDSQQRSLEMTTLSRSHRRAASKGFSIIELLIAMV